MTYERQQYEIAKACGKLDRFVLLKRGLYWRPNAHGYTDRISEAWILTEAEADKHVYPHGEPVTKQRAPLPNYDSLDEMHEAEKVLHGNAHKSAITDEERAYRDHLAKIMGVAWYQSAVLLRASCSHRREAFLRTFNLWTD